MSGAEWLAQIEQLEREHTAYDAEHARLEITLREASVEQKDLKNRQKSAHRARTAARVPHWQPQPPQLPFAV